MQPQDTTLGDVLVSLIIGGAFGYVCGGLWNLLQGKTWSGNLKKTTR